MTAFTARMRRIRPRLRRNDGNLGSAYLDSVKYRPGLANVCRPDLRIESFPNVQSHPADARIVALPALDINATPPISVARAIAERRSSRRYSAIHLSLRDVSALLQLSVGCNPVNESGKRVVPSGGPGYPIYAYLLATRVDGIALGYYRFDPLACHLATISAGNEPHPMLWDGFERAASCFLFFVLDVSATRIKYGDLAYKLALLEAGHAAQNALLVATALGLNACPLLYYPDDIVNREMRLDGVDRLVVYAIEIGGKPHDDRH